jgi:hypothetical protein
MKNHSKVVIRYFWAGVLFFTFLFTGCTFPYDPQPEPALRTTTVVQSSGSARVFPVNGTAQICNPSIVLDTATFPGCMLWLNFSGELEVDIPDGMQSYAGWSLQHDRLSIVDTSNTVRWFMMREEFGADEREELQDPEWSAHPEYLVCLVSSGVQARWGCYAVHPKTRKRFQLCSEGLDQTSTPHLWVERTFSVGSEPASTRFNDDGCADSTSLATFFGTNRVKMAAAKLNGRTLSLIYRDFSDVSGTWIALERPADRAGWQCESPLISPDGNWIIFNAYRTPDYYETYIQKLTRGSRPVLLQREASDPHWWVHPEDTSLLYIVYQYVPGDNLVYGDLADPKYQNTGELGQTLRQSVRLFAGASTAAASVLRIGQPQVLVNLPTKGGLSPDGRYVCTGYDRAFIVGLP